MIFFLIVLFSLRITLTIHVIQLWWLGSFVHQCTIQCIHILAIGGWNPVWGMNLYSTIAVIINDSLQWTRYMYAIGLLYTLRH